VDNVSETSETDMSETTTASVARVRPPSPSKKTYFRIIERGSQLIACAHLQFYMVAEHVVEGTVIPALGCPRRAVCPSCSSETGT